ncbi:MAG: SDR family NAD(P)-dependent oxidoreductase [Actinobacteria bacterium]|nr:SDR family NAD(P)-dependent oxidoreductase [Actinomycetota bacterium]
MKFSAASTISLAAALGTTLVLRPRAEDDLRGEVAVVTGASRGLGLLLATELAGRGCRLLICARDEAELDEAAARLRATGAEVATVTCDLTGAGAAERLVEAARERYGRLDIVVANAGIIRVGPVESTTPADYETAVALMALAPVRLALAALPVMQAQGHGRIVTITSIGGKLSVPHLLPYSTAKFAAVGFSEGLRAELGRRPVTVTTVVPGLMRTGSHLNAEFAGRQDEEFTWFGLGASLPVISMDAERAARQIVAGVAQRRPEVLLTPAGQVVSRLAAVSPGLTATVLHAVQNLALPAPDADGQAEPGRQLRPSLPEPVYGALTTLGRAAAQRFNQLGRPAGRAQKPEEQAQV